MTGVQTCAFRSAVVINIARGEIIDETALIEALDEKKFLSLVYSAQQCLTCYWPLPTH